MQATSLQPQPQSSFEFANINRMNYGPSDRQPWFQPFSHSSAQFSDPSGPERRHRSATPNLPSLTRRVPTTNVLPQSSVPPKRLLAYAPSSVQGLGRITPYHRPATSHRATSLDPAALHMRADLYHPPFPTMDQADHTIAAPSEDFPYTSQPTESGLTGLRMPNATEVLAPHFQPTEELNLT